MNRIAVTAPRGGIGKTFVACNLAFYLHHSRMRVSPCIIDFGAHSPASKYIDREAYWTARQRHEDSFAFRSTSSMVVACCEDWDKALESSTKHEAFKEIMTNPLTGSPVLRRTLENYDLLGTCDGFIYDTDHYVRTLIKFLFSFQRVILLFDDNDPASMENLASAWIYYSNSHTGELVKRRPRKTFVVANRTLNAERAKTRLLRTCEAHFRHELAQSDTDRMLQEISELCVSDFAIPKFRQANASFEHSAPMWEFVEEAKNTFRQPAALIR